MSRYILIIFLEKIKVDELEMIKKNMGLLAALLFTTTLLTGSAFGQEMSEHAELFFDAEASILQGDYEKAIKLYDEMLETYPTEYKIFEMKALALSNLRLESTLAMQPQQNTISRDPSNLNRASMLEVYKALEINPNSTLALNLMGLGFGNFGEYSEAERYFDKSIKLDPDNQITKNYISAVKDVKEKYSLDVFEQPTKKPDFLQVQENNTVPEWVKNNAGWWAADEISDSDFFSGIEYLIENNIITVTPEEKNKNSPETVPNWVKSNARWWAAGEISDEDFLLGIKYLIENNIIKVNVETNSDILARKAWSFDRYLKDIQNDMKKQNRYVENLNPSEYVIIKYWKDYHKWNLEEFLTKPDIFPNRNVWIDEEMDRYVIEYKVYINDQPPGLPIDHISTLTNSFSFWESYDFTTTDGKTAVVKFSTTNMKSDANVWVTWVVRSMGEGVLGHATLGKGVIEVAIGNYGCDGSFQLFDKETVEYVMTHELGHSLGLGHSSNPDNIMYSTVQWTGYSYCLLN